MDKKAEPKAKSPLPPPVRLHRTCILKHFKREEDANGYAWGMEEAGYLVHVIGDLTGVSVEAVKYVPEK